MVRKILENFEKVGQHTATAYRCIRIWLYNYSHEEMLTYEEFNSDGKIIRKTHIMQELPYLTQEYNKEGK